MTTLVSSVRTLYGLSFSARLIFAVGSILMFAMLGFFSPAFAATPLELVSVSTNGIQGNGYTGLDYPPSVSADGRYVTFTSPVAKLATGDISGDTNGVQDVFVHDMLTGSTTRINLAPDGSQANGESRWATISGNGRYIVYNSAANNLVPNDTNGVFDIFVYDMVTGSTTRVSVAPDGSNGNTTSGAAFPATISYDGRYVAFSSTASNLVSDDTNGLQDVFVRDMVSGVTTRISVAPDGSQANGISQWAYISGDGTRVVYSSIANNLVSGDTNGREDVFAYNTLTGAITLVSTATDGTQGNTDSGIGSRSSISFDGRFVVFSSNADNLVAGDTNGFSDLFLKDMQTGATTRITMGFDGSQTTGNTAAAFPAMISSDGRYVAFSSAAPNLVPNDSNGLQDMFVRDLLIGTTSLVSLAPDGSQANGLSQWANISGDNRYIVFASAASNLVPNDINGNTFDIFFGENPLYVAPQTPQEQVVTIINTIPAIGIAPNVAHPYYAHLNNAARFIDNNRTTQAIAQLQVFIDEVNTDFSQGSITQEQRDQLTTLAQTLIAALQ